MPMPTGVLQMHGKNLLSLIKEMDCSVSNHTMENIWEEFTVVDKGDGLFSF